VVARDETRIYDQDSNERLDIFLTTNLDGFSRSRIQALIKDGQVKVNSVTVTKTGHMVNSGDRVEIHIPAPVPSNLVAEDIPLEIIFQNSDLVVINKPAGMVVHPSPGHYQGTLVHAALSRIPEIQAINGEERPGIVHRLDKDTSGLIIIAKNEKSLHWLQEQFKSRQVEKTYLALVDGKPPTPSGRIEAPIGRNSSHRKLMAVVPDEKGRQAVTLYKTLEVFPNHTLLEIHPLTGRTHQIRVHMTFLGCPVAGDQVYGKRKPTISMNRQFLHAQKLKIQLPGEKQARVFEAPLPDDMLHVLDMLRNT
jgi:23S rRNA pseudouridine1911/1915/1917 synthase